MKKIYFSMLGTVLCLMLSAQNWSLKTEWTFTQTTGDAWRRVDFDPSNLNNGFVFNNSGYISRTTDGGANWGTLNKAHNSQNFEIGKYIAPNTVLTAASNVIFKSIDNGQTFTSLQTSTGVSPWMIEADGNFILIGGFSGYISWSKDGGASFQSQKIFPTIVRCEAKVVNQNFGFVYTKDGIKFTTDMGETWQDLLLNGLTVSGQNFAFPHPSLWQYWLGAKSANEWMIRLRYDNDIALFRTTNGGQNWENITNSLKNICNVTGNNMVEIEAIEILPDGKVFAVHPFDNYKYQRVAYSPDFGSTFTCEQVVMNNTIDAVNSSLKPIGFRRFGNKLFLLAFGDVSDNYEVYERTVGTATSIIGEQASNSTHDFKLYPNVSNGQFTIDGPANSTYHVFDITGKQVAHLFTTQPVETIRLNIMAGLYFVKNEVSTTIKKLLIE